MGDEDQLGIANRPAAVQQIGDAGVAPVAGPESEPVNEMIFTEADVNTEIVAQGNAGASGGSGDPDRDDNGVSSASGGSVSGDDDDVSERDQDRAGAIVDALAGEILEAADEGTSSTRIGPARGRPRVNRRVLRHGWASAGSTRMDALTRSYGKDALILGHLLFQIPPLAIRIKKGNITYRWKPLRTKESIAVKSGNGECYIEIDLAFVGLSQINNSLAHLITLWKKVPFCFVENAHIRNMMIPDQPEDSMMVCLESLVLDAVAGSPDAVWATLILSWFNYKPFSQNAWYRRNWTGIGSPDPVTTPTTEGESAEEEGRSIVRNAIPVSDRDTTIVDLSGIDAPETMNFSLPPELRLDYPEAETDRSDPFVRATYPVVYPWNSIPFMQRVLQGTDQPRTTNSWNDGLVFNWRSFVRKAMPSSLVYTAGQASVPITRHGNTRGRAAEGEVLPVDGDRNVILFLGDSITVGYLHISGAFPDLAGARERTQPIPLHEITPPGEFTQEGRGSGFTFYSIARVGSPITGSLGFAKRFEDLIQGEEFTSAEGSIGDRLAMVVWMGGINDHIYNAARMTALTAAYVDIKDRAQLAGAIAVPITIWPIMRIWDNYINTSEENNYKALNTLITGGEHPWTQGANARISVINLHAADPPVSTDPGSFNGLPHPDIRTGGTSTGEQSDGGEENYNPHPRSYRRLTEWIASQMPWSAAADRSTSSETWTVCFVEDGDTIWVTQENILRQVRMKFIDTLETYTQFANVSDTAEFTRGQDTGRPPEYRYGALAKAALIEMVQGTGANGSGGVVQIEFASSPDIYNRWLGVVSKGELNLNLELVRRGLALTQPEYRDPQEGAAYIQAQHEAETRTPSAEPNIHNWQAVGTNETTTVRTEPWDWRVNHPPRTPEDGGEFDFGSSGRPSGCEGEIEVAGQDGVPGPRDEIIEN